MDLFYDMSINAELSCYLLIWQWANFLIGVSQWQENWIRESFFVILLIEEKICHGMCVKSVVYYLLKMKKKSVKLIIRF